MKIEGSASGSISQRHGSADPDPHQNVMDLEHCFLADMRVPSVCAGAGGGLWGEQATRRNAAPGPPGQRSQVHGSLPEAAHFLLTLQGFHLVSAALIFSYFL